MTVPLEDLLLRRGVPVEHLAAVLEALQDHASGMSTLFDGENLLSLGDETPTSPSRAVLALPPRYEDLGPVGVGGMGEVRRVRDRALNAVLAMKILHADLLGKPELVARFLEEAQAQAQLVHPGIVPVHDLDVLPDGRPYFTMAWIQGRTLSEVIAEVHRASTSDWRPGARGWTFRRLVEAFARVCSAVAYAHDRSVVHRDLKPDNVVVGPFGEVMVLDWGLAKVVGRPDRAAAAGVLAPVRTERSVDGAQVTRMGQVAGTPAYMPPEQARGEVDRVDARSDVYALGAMLYEVLRGRPPYEGSAAEVLHAVLSGPPPELGQAGGAGVTFGFGTEATRAPLPAAGQGAMLAATLGLGEHPGPALPEELVLACERAMARDPADRFASASDLASEVTAWLEGARRREQALAVVEAAVAHGPKADSLRLEAAAKRAAANALLEPVKSWEPEEVKVPGWALQDAAAALEADADLEELALEEGLQGALRIDATLPEAHEALAARYLAAHEAAEAQRDRVGAAKAARRLVQHVDTLPSEHPTRVHVATYLEGNGAVTLVTDPPGAEVMLERFVERNRRLVAEPVRSLGRTPLRAVSLPMGSYLLRLRAEGHDEVRYPVHVARGGHWDGVPPGGKDPHPVWLPPAGLLGRDACYVPAGWFEAGGDAEARDSLPRGRVWLPGFAMARFPVTNRQYLAFLDDLVRQGREADALRWAPRERAGREGELGAMVYGRRPDGAFELVADAEGDRWLPEWPVVLVDPACAEAYASWWSARTGAPWVLPSELAWEKAARGVDGRWYPWGDAFDPSWCCMTASHSGRRLPAAVDSFPVDESVYGVRGLGGNVCDWTASAWRQPEAPASKELASGLKRVFRGGSWRFSAQVVRVAYRSSGSPGSREGSLGFRLVRSVP